MKDSSWGGGVEKLSMKPLCPPPRVGGKVSRVWLLSHKTPKNAQKKLSDTKNKHTAKRTGS